jgi:integrase
MAKRGLTDISVRNLRPRETRREVPDPAQRGLYVIVQPTGRKGYAVRYRFYGVPRKLTLTPGISLAAARKLAGDAMLAVAEGNDPAALKKDARREAAAAAGDTLRAVCDEYFRRDGAKLRSRDQQQATLARHVYPTFGNRPIHSIMRREIIRLLDGVEDRAGPRAADLTLAYVGKIMNWHAIRDEAFRSPIIKGMRRQRAGERARSRILSDTELVAVWTAAAAPGPFPALVRFLLLTAARRSEASHLEWSEIQNNGDWLLPSARNKAKQDLLRPLSAAAKQLLNEQLTKQIEGCKFVFSSDGVHPYGAYSDGKKQFDIACGVTDWRLHDLRRTARSLLSRAGINSDYAERCLGHVIGGVRGVYDRHEYYAEKKQAYEALAAQIARIVDPTDNVVELRRG